MQDFGFTMERKSRIALVFGEVLRELRTKKRFSQEALASESDLDRKFMHLLEQGHRQPSLTTILKLAKTLEIAPHEIVKMVEERLATSSKRK